MLFTVQIKANSGSTCAGGESKACRLVYGISIPVGIPRSNLSYLAVMLTAVAAPTPPPAYTNIYITLNELELGSKMYIAWFSLMQFKTAKP